jgi:tripartite-type tricarboxylate transporter receptor subunit TctC
MPQNTSGKRPRSLTVLGSVFTIALAAAGCGSEDDAGTEEGAYFDGKTITVHVPFGAGGGVDTATRFIVDRAVEHLEGNVTVEYVNQAGGGSVPGANQWALSDEGDGLRLLATSPTTMLPWILGQDVVQYDFQEMTPLWGHPAGRVMYAHPDTGVETLADLQDPDEPLVTGARTAAGVEITSLLALDALELTDQVKVVMGYEDGASQAIAYEQGELNLNHQPTATYVRDWQQLEEDGQANMLFTHGLLEEGEWVRDPAMPDTPTLYEAYVDAFGEEPSGDSWEAFRALVSLVGTGNYGVWVGDDAPQEAVDELQSAFEAAIAEPDYQAEADDIVGPYGSVVGEAVKSWATDIRNLDEDVLSYIRTFARDVHGVEDVGN